MTKVVYSEEDNFRRRSHVHVDGGEGKEKLPAGRAVAGAVSRKSRGANVLSFSVSSVEAKS
jgi:hypothetical protein